MTALSTPNVTLTNSSPTTVTSTSPAQLKLDEEVARRLSSPKRDKDEVDESVAAGNGKHGLPM
jgi:hypothetical protein